MKPGDLVEIKRASIGTPKGTVALITETVHTDPSDQHDVIKYYIVRLFGVNSSGQNILRERRYLEMDLEVISGSR
jgi:hypothetical protein